MHGEIALDSTTAIRYLNGDQTVVEKVLALPTVVLPLVVKDGRKLWKDKPYLFRNFGRTLIVNELPKTDQIRRILNE